jgi:hypothetical protein
MEGAGGMCHRGTGKYTYNLETQQQWSCYRKLWGWHVSKRRQKATKLRCVTSLKSLIRRRQYAHFCNFSLQTGQNRLGSAKWRKVAINTNSHRVDVRTLGDYCVMLAAEIKEIKPRRQLNNHGAHKTSQLNHSSGPWRAIRNTLSFPIKMKWLVYRPPHVLPPSDGATTTFLIPALKMTFISEQLCPWRRERGSGAQLWNILNTMQRTGLGERSRTHQTCYRICVS